MVFLVIQCRLRKLDDRPERGGHASWSLLVLAEIHEEVGKVASSRIVQTERFQTPLVGLVGVVHSSAVAAFERDCHLIDVEIAAALKVTAEIEC